MLEPSIRVAAEGGGAGVFMAANVGTVHCISGIFTWAL